MGRDSAEPTLLVFGILCAVGGLFLFTINVWAALGCIAFGIALLSPMIFRSKKINANNQAKDARYSESMSRYQAEVARIERDNADRQNKYNYEIAAWRRNYDQNMSALRQPLTETEKVLANYYSSNVIADSRLRRSSKT